MLFASFQLALRSHRQSQYYTKEETSWFTEANLVQFYANLSTVSLTRTRFSFPFNANLNMSKTLNVTIVSINLRPQKAKSDTFVAIGVYKSKYLKVKQAASYTVDFSR